jgi:hypothetical protein
MEVEEETKMNIPNRDELMIAVANRIPLATLTRIIDRARLLIPVVPQVNITEQQVNVVEPHAAP